MYRVSEWYHSVLSCDILSFKAPTLNINYIHCENECTLEVKWIQQLNIIMI